MRFDNDIKEVLSSKFSELCELYYKYNSKPLYNIRLKTLENLLSKNFDNIKEIHSDVLSELLSLISMYRVHSGRGQLLRGQITRFLLDDAITLVFVNGVFNPYLSKLDLDTQGIDLGNIISKEETQNRLVREVGNSSLTSQKELFAMLNSIFFTDGSFVIIKNAGRITKSIQIVYYSSSEDKFFVAHPRNIIKVDNGSEVKIVEMYIGTNSLNYFNNIVTEISVEDNSVLEHYKLQFESSSANHIYNANVNLQSGSKYYFTHISAGGRFSANNFNITAENDVLSELYGLSLGRREQKFDDYFEIHHTKKNNRTRELFKFVLDDTSSASFKGRIMIDKDALKTEASQSSKALLISDKASIDTQPHLEIFADDVKCSHSATVGHINMDQIFYLQSRGFSKESAKEIMINAFANEILEKVYVSELNYKINELFLSKVQKN